MILYLYILYSLMIGQQDPQHVGVSGLYNIILNLTQLCVFVSLNYSNCIVTNGVKNVKCNSIGAYPGQ